MNRKTLNLIIVFIFSSTLIGSLSWSMGFRQAAVAWSGSWNRWNTDGTFEAQYINTTALYLSGTDVSGRLGGTWTVPITTTTLDTGQGANELYDMDQNVQTTDSVTFGNVDSSGYVNATQFYWNSENRTEFLQYRDPTPSGLADHEFSGDFIYGTAGENLAIGEVVFLESDGKYWKADCNASTTMYCVAMALETINADASGRFLIDGYLRDDTWAGWTVGSESPLYVSGTAGAMTQSIPNTSGDQVQIIGYPIAAKIIRFDPDSTVVEIS